MSFLDKTGLSQLWTNVKSKFQEILVSGENIKTINGNDILGSGDITTSGITEITDTVAYIYDLEPGIYILPSKCSVRYGRTPSEISYDSTGDEICIIYGGYLFVYSKGDYKKFIVLNAGSTTTSTECQLYVGYATTTSGDYSTVKLL